MNHKITKSISGEKMEWEIPVYEITDPYAYVHASRVIAHIDIIGTNGRQKRKLMRTKNGCYLMTA